MITGRNDGDAAQAVIVELKQWQTVGQSSSDECVTAFVGGRERDVLHPSKQVGQYQRYLQDVHTAFNDGSVGLAACGYLHNMTFDPGSEIYAERHREPLERDPPFTGHQAGPLA